MTAMQPISQASALPVRTFSIPENNQELSEAITHLAGHINAAQYRFLKLLAALVEREAWLGDSGMKTPAHWLNYHCGIALGAAREKVRVAKCLATLPQIDAAFSSGTISYSKVRAMTRSATPENEAHLLQVARHGTAQHVEKLVRKFERVKRPADPAHDKRQDEARELTWHYDDDGMLVFRGRLPTEEGAAFVKTLQAMLAVPEAAASKDETNTDVSAETSDENSAPTYAQKRADALVAMADMAKGAVTAGAKPVTSADKYQVIIHIEAERAKSVSAETSEHSPCTLESEGCHFPWRHLPFGGWLVMPRW